MTVSSSETPAEAMVRWRKLRNRFIAKMRARVSHYYYGPVGASGTEWLQWVAWCEAGIKWAKGNAQQNVEHNTNG